MKCYKGEVKVMYLMDYSIESTGVFLIIIKSLLDNAKIELHLSVVNKYKSIMSKNASKTIFLSHSSDIYCCFGGVLDFSHS